MPPRNTVHTSWIEFCAGATAGAGTALLGGVPLAGVGASSAKASVGATVKSNASTTRLGISYLVSGHSKRSTWHCSELAFMFGPASELWPMRRLASSTWISRRDRLAHQDFADRRIGGAN